MDDLFAGAREIEINGVKVMVTGPEGAEQALVWRFADARPDDLELTSHFSGKDPGLQRSLINQSDERMRRRGMTGTPEDMYYAETAKWHAKEAQIKYGPWVSTGAQLAKIVRTSDLANVYATRVLGADTLYLLRIPIDKVNTDYIKLMPETEILAKAMYESVRPHVVAELPNLFQDRDLTYGLRPEPKRYP